MPGGVKRGTWAAIAAVSLLVLALGAGRELGGPPDSQARVGDGRGGIAKRKIGRFVAPTYVTHAPGRSGFLYVVQQLMHVNRKFNLPVLVTWMLLLGLFLGFATDFVLEAAEHAG